MSANEEKPSLMDKIKKPFRSHSHSSSTTSTSADTSTEGVVDQTHRENNPEVITATSVGKLKSAGSQPSPQSMAKEDKTTDRVPFAASGAPKHPNDHPEYRNESKAKGEAGAFYEQKPSFTNPGSTANEVVKLAYEEGQRAARREYEEAEKQREQSESAASHAASQRKTSRPKNASIDPEEEHAKNKSVFNAVEQPNRGHQGNQSETSTLNQGKHKEGSIPPSSKNFDYETELKKLDKQIEKTQEEIDSLQKQSIPNSSIGSAEEKKYTDAAYSAGVKQGSYASGVKDFAKDQNAPKSAYTAGVKQGAYDAGYEEKEKSDVDHSTYQTAKSSPAASSKDSPGVISTAQATISSAAAGLAGAAAKYTGFSTSNSDHPIVREAYRAGVEMGAYDAGKHYHHTEATKNHKIEQPVLHDVGSEDDSSEERVNPATIVGSQVEGQPRAFTQDREQYKTDASAQPSAYDKRSSSTTSGGITGAIASVLPSWGSETKKDAEHAPNTSGSSQTASGYEGASRSYEPESKSREDHASKSSASTGSVKGNKGSLIRSAEENYEDVRKAPKHKGTHKTGDTTEAGESGDGVQQVPGLVPSTEDTVKTNDNESPKISEEDVVRYNKEHGYTNKSGSLIAAAEKFDDVRDTPSHSVSSTKGEEVSENKGDEVQKVPGINKNSTNLSKSSTAKTSSTDTSSNYQSGKSVDEHKQQNESNFATSARGDTHRSSTHDSVHGFNPEHKVRDAPGLGGIGLPSAEVETQNEPRQMNVAAAGGSTGGLDDRNPQEYRKTVSDLPHPQEKPDSFPVDNQNAVQPKHDDNGPADYQKETSPKSSVARKSSIGSPRAAGGSFDASPRTSVNRSSIDNHVLASRNSVSSDKRKSASSARTSVSDASTVPPYAANAATGHTLGGASGTPSGRFGKSRGSVDGSIGTSHQFEEQSALQSAVSGISAAGAAAASATGAAVGGGLAYLAGQDKPTTNKTSSQPPVPAGDFGGFNDSSFTNQKSETTQQAEPSAPRDAAYAAGVQKGAYEAGGHEHTRKSATDPNELEVEVIGEIDRDKATVLAQKVSKSLMNKGYDLTSGKIVLDTKSGEICLNEKPVATYHETHRDANRESYASHSSGLGEGSASTSSSSVDGGEYRHAQNEIRKVHGETPAPVMPGSFSH